MIFVEFDKYFFSPVDTSRMYIRVIAQVGIWFLRYKINFQLTLSLISNRVSIRRYFLRGVESIFLFSIVLSKFLRKKRNIIFTSVFDFP